MLQLTEEEQHFIVLEKGEFLINLANQKIDQFNWIMACFFPKIYSTIYFCEISYELYPLFVVYIIYMQDLEVCHLAGLSDFYFFII